MYDEIFEASEDTSNDWVIRQGPNGNSYREFNHENFGRIRAKIGALKWRATKLSAKKYRVRNLGK